MASKRAYRRSVLALFALNGFLYASWAARVPQIQAQYGIDDSTMGFVLIAASGGAFASMPFAAYINERLGVSRVALLSSLVYIAVLPAIALGSSAPVLFALYGAMGVGFGLLDVAMNAQAVEVERLYARSIISSFHAGFSGSMIAGALVGSAVIALDWPFAWHLTLASALGLGLLAFAHTRRLPDELLDAHATADEGSGDAFRLPVRATWLIGAIGFCSMMSEASISDWTAKYMLEVAESGPAISTWSLAAFSIAMTVGRLRGDRLRDTIGDPAILRWGSLLALGGLALSLALPHPFTTILGAGLVGTGLSVAVPIVFSLSGKLPGLSPSAALAMVTTISYLGLFIGPAVIGFLAEGFGLRVGYGFILAALGVLVVLVRRLRVPAVAAPTR